MPTTRSRTVDLPSRTTVPVRSRSGSDSHKRTAIGDLLPSLEKRRDPRDNPMIRRSRRRSTSRVPSGFDPPARAIGPVLQGHAQAGEPVANLVGEGEVLFFAESGAEVDQELQERARQRV